MLTPQTELSTFSRNPPTKLDLTLYKLKNIKHSKNGKPSIKNPESLTTISNLAPP